MSNVLDDNVVILRFDNSDFEKNTKQSMDTLDKLKQSVNNTSGESLDGLSKAANNVNLSGLGKAIDTINNRFSTMGIIGMSAINKLTSSAMSSVANIATAIPRQMIQGGWKRALNIERAEFLMKGLGVAFEGSFTAATDTAEEKIEGVKGAVLAAVNKTRYGLDEAAKAAATLMASNENLKEDHVQLANRLRAISGVAAVTSSEFSDISYIFTKVAGQGKMMTNELNMLSMKGFNAAVEIQHYLNQNGKIKEQALDNAIAMGKQTKKMEEIRKHAELTEGDVRDMVSAGAIDFDIMSDSLLHFFETASGANDTYEGSLANVKASFSRMGAQFEATKLKNLTKVFNYLLPVLQKFEDFIKPFTDRMNEFSDTVTDFIGENIINPLGKAMGLKSKDLFPGVKEAIEDTAKGVDDANKKTQNSSAKTKKEILALNKEYQASRDIWYKGTYGNGSRRKNALEQLGISYEETQKIINQFYDDGYKWDKIENQLVKDYQERNKASDDAANKTTESAEKQAKVYPTMIALVKSFVNLLASAKLVLEGFKNIVVFVGKSIKTALAPGVKSGANLFERFTEKILNAARRFKEFSEILTDTKKRTAWLEDHKWIDLFVSAISTGFVAAKEAIFGFINVIKDFFTQFSETEGFNALKEQLEGLLDIFRDMAGGALGKVTGQLDKLSGIGASSNMDKVVGFFSRLASGLANMISEVRRGENPLRGFIGILGTVKDSLSFKSLKSHGISAGINALSAKNGTIAMVVNATKALKGVDVKGTFGKASDSIFNFFDGLTSKVKKADIGGKLKSVFDALKNADWKEISKVAFYFGSLAAIIKTVRDAGRLVDAAVGTLGSISGMFKSIANVANTYAAQVKAQNFQLIAISVAILIGSMIALAAVPADKLKPAVASVVIVLGMLAGIMALMTKKLDPTAAYQVGAAFAAMGASMLLIATACKILAGIDGAGMLKAGVAIVGFMAMMAIVSKMSRSLFSSGLVFISMAAAVNMLVVAVMAFAIIPWGVLLKGAAAIAIFMTELAVGARIAGSANATGLLAMALALNILIPAIILFSMMPLEKALKGATIACGIIAMIGLAARIAGDSAKNTLSVVSLAAMVTALTASMVILSMIDTKRLITAASALTATMLSLAAAAKFASTAKTGLALMSLAIGMITASIIALIKIDPQAAIKIANSLTLLAVGLGVAFSLFGKLGIKGNLIGAGGLTLAIGVITGIVAALGKLYESDKARQLMSNGKEMAQMLGDAIGAFFGGIVSSFGVAATSGLGTMADNISAFATKIKPFLAMVTGIDTKAVQGAKDLADAIFQLTKADFVESLSVFSGVENLAERMKELGTGFTEFSSAVESIPEGTIEKANTASEVIKTLASAFGEIPKTGGKLQWFTGEADIEGFIGGIISVAKALGNNGKGKAGLAELDIPDDLLGENGKITKIAEVIKTMAIAAEKIPETGGIVQKITGEHDIAGMANGILSMATVLGSNQEGLHSLATIEIPDGLTAEDGKITKICEVIAAMSSAAELIPESAGGKQLILGNTTINEFATQLANAIPGLKKFIGVVGSETFAFDDSVKEKIIRVAEAVGAMGEAADKIPPGGISLSSIVFGGKDLSDFASELSLAIPGLQDFASGLGSLSFQKGTFTKNGKLNHLVTAIKAMADVADALPSEGGWAQKLLGEKDLGSFGSKLKELLESLDKVKDVKLDPKSLGNAAKALDIIVPSVKNFKNIGAVPTGANLSTLGKNAASFAESLGGANTKNLAAKATAIKTAASKMGSAAKSGAASLGKTEGFSSAGSTLGNDFVKGLKGKAASAKSAGAALAKQAKSGAGSVSLSGVGKDVGQGFVDGINAKKQAAYNAGSALGYRAKAGAKAAVNSSSPAKEFIKIGKFVGEGFVMGMQAYERKVYKKGEDVGKMSIAGTQDGIVHTMGDLINPVITPVVDLSDVNRGLDSMDNAFSRNRAIGINSTFESSDYKTNKMMNDVVNSLNKLNDNKQPSSNYFTFNVDGAENPEEFAKRFVRQVELEMRTG